MTQLRLYSSYRGYLVCFDWTFFFEDSRHAADDAESKEIRAIKSLFLWLLHFAGLGFVFTALRSSTLALTGCILSPLAPFRMPVHAHFTWRWNKGYDRASLFGHHTTHIFWEDSRLAIQVARKELKALKTCMHTPCLHALLHAERGKWRWQA
jgi:hypothetical protein